MEIGSLNKYIEWKRIKQEKEDQIRNLNSADEEIIKQL